MTIEKQGKIYAVLETATAWKVARQLGGVEVSYSVPKADCPTFDALNQFVIESDLF